MSNSRKFLVRIIAAASTFVSYPVGSGCWVLGFPFPFVVFEPSDDGKMLIPFVSPLSIIFILANVFVIDSAVKFLFKRLPNTWKQDLSLTMQTPGECTPSRNSSET